MEGFHLQQGLYFKRESDGRITISITQTPMVDAPVIFTTTCDVSGFASVMASMSARDETAETWKEAVEFLSRAQ